jgi:hypothetical protein
MEREAKIIPLKSINPQKENLTPEKLKTFSGNENLNEQAAIDTVFALQTFSNILYELMSEQSKIKQSKIAA